MARIKHTAIVANIRGALSGTSFLKGKSGPFVASKNSGTTTNSTLATLHRNRFAVLQRLWKELSEEERLSWQMLASQYPKADKDNTVIYPSGFTLFMELNTNRVTTDQIPLLLAPALEQVGNVESVELSIDFTTPILSVSFSPTPVPAGKFLLIFATKYSSKGVSNKDFKYKFIKAIPAATASPVDITTEYLSTLPQPLVNSVVSVKGFYQQSATGQRSKGSASQVNTVVSPLPMLGLLLWVESTSFVSAMAVSNWVDLSGNGNHLTQGVPLFQPSAVMNVKNGQPAVLFAPNQYLNVTIPIPTTGSWEQLIVLKKNDTSTSAIGLGNTTTHTPLPFLQLTESDIYVRSDTTISNFTGSLILQWNIFNTNADSNVPHCFQNGIELAPTNIASVNLNANMNVFGRASGAYTDAYILMCMFWNRVLTPTERAQVNAYVQSVYGSFP